MRVNQLLQLKMPQLELLDINRWDGLNELPENFSENFCNLKNLDISFCDMESFPKTRIDLRNTGFKKAIDNPKIANFRDKIKKISKELSKATVDVDFKFRELIEYGEKTGFYSDYDYLYAHYGRVYCYTHGIVLHEKDELKQIDKMLEFEEIFREIYGGLS